MIVREEHLSKRLSQYGEVRFAYTGSAGRLTLADGTQHDCAFEAGQLETGEVVLLCIIPDPRYFLGADTATFTGTDSNGWVIEAENLDTVTYLPSEQQLASYIACHAPRLVATASAPAPAEAVEHRFGLTNLRFTGIEGHVERDARGRIRLAERVLGVNLVEEGRPSVRVMVRSNIAQTNTARRLGVSRICAVTSEAVVRQDLSTDILSPIIDDLSILLSVARGTRIQSVFVESLDATGAPVRRVHNPGLGRPYNALMVLADNDTHAEATRDFIERGYPLLVSRGAELDLLGGVLQAYIDARSEHDFIETRGVKLAVVAEMLKFAYLRHPEATVHEFEESWPKGFWPSLRRSLGRRAVSLGIAKSLSDRLSGKPRRTRTGFRKVLRALLKHVGYAATDHEIDLFVRSRDTLIHQGRFLTDVASTADRKRFPQLKDRVSEYFFLVSFLDRVMLKLLGYSGPFVDWSKHPSHERGNLP